MNKETNEDREKMSDREKITEFVMSNDVVGLETFLDNIIEDAYKKLSEGRKKRGWVK